MTRTLLFGITLVLGWTLVAAGAIGALAGVQPIANPPHFVVVDTVEVTAPEQAPDVAVSEPEMVTPAAAVPVTAEPVGSLPQAEEDAGTLWESTWGRFETWRFRRGFSGGALQGTLTLGEYASLGVAAGLAVSDATEEQDSVLVFEVHSDVNVTL